MNTKEIINAVAKEIEDKGGIRQVFLVACGGSLVDMYPAKYFLDSEATTLHVGMYTANEFVYATPKTLGVNSLVIVCSHGGNTPESVAAAKLAQQHQAHTITLTHNAQAQLMPGVTIPMWSIIRWRLSSICALIRCSRLKVSIITLISNREWPKLTASLLMAVSRLRIAASVLPKNIRMKNSSISSPAELLTAMLMVLLSAH